MSSYDSAVAKQIAERAAGQEADDLTPVRDAVPLIVSNPYGTRSITMLPQELARIVMAETMCDPATAEWLHNNQISALLSNLGGIGITVLDAKISRHKLDLDRRPDSIDWGLTNRGAHHGKPQDDDWYGQNGLGIAWLRLPNDLDMPLYSEGNEPLPKDLTNLIAQEYVPFHEMLQSYINAHAKKFGGSLHISIQPMSRMEADMFFGPNDRPEFIISDDNGQTAASDIRGALMDAIQAKGYNVTLNDQVPTGELTTQHCAPNEGRHSLQLKIDEGLFFDADRLERAKTYRKLSYDLHAIMHTMATKARELIVNAQPQADVVTHDDFLDRLTAKRANKSGPGGNHPS